MSSRIELPLCQLAEDFIRSGLYLRGWSKTTVRTYRQGLSSLQQSLDASATSPSQADVLLNKAQLEVREQMASSEPLTSLAPKPPTITKEQLSNWVISLRQKGLTPGGINMYIRTINSFLSWLKEEQHIPQEIRLKLLPNPQKPLRGFQDNEIRSLLSFRPKGHYELRTWTCIVLLLDTGCRIDELLTLHITEVNLDNLVIVVKGKGNKTRHVPISLECRKSLFRYLQSKKLTGTNGYLFRTSSGLHLSYRNTYRDIKNLCAKAGVVGSHVHPHAFRHCFAVTYVRRGGDLYRLSRILGHTSIATTQLYLRSMGIEQIGENHSSLSPLSRA